MGYKADTGNYKDGRKKLDAIPVGYNRNFAGALSEDLSKEDKLVRKLKNSKGLLLLATVTLVPFGLVGLGIWKAMEIYKKLKKK